MHYYQHHIGDFIRDTANLNDHQVATYLRMLWAYYDSEKPISGELEDIAFAMRSDEKTVRLLLRHYFKEAEDGWHHTRCDKEIAEYQAKSEKARKSASARWGDANAKRPHTERKATAPVSDANQEPITNNQEPVVKEKAPRKRAAPPPPIQKPDDVDQQTWDDWLLLRKSKGAPVTETVINGARKESSLAGMPLDAFLQVWCLRGSQGLQADWLRPDERATRSRVQYPAETPYQAQQLALATALAPGAARKPHNHIPPGNVFDAEEVSYVDYGH